MFKRFLILPSWSVDSRLWARRTPTPGSYDELHPSVGPSCLPTRLPVGLWPAPFIDRSFIVVLSCTVQP